MTEREFAVDVCRRLREAGYRSLFAGGCVRDELLGLTPADYDVATDATPPQVQELFRRCILVGASFGVVEVLGPKAENGDWLKVQVATFRSDGSYSDGRRPDEVTFSSPEEDAARRDFTVNALFGDPISGAIIDYVGGQADLAAKILRAVGDPAKRFAEDKLRILRAVRMAARFDLAIDPATQAAARAMAPQIAAVSAERIGEETRKILSHPRRGRGAFLLAELGLVPVLFPELKRPWGEIVSELAALPTGVLPALPRFGGEGGGEGEGISSASPSPLTLTLSPEAGERGPERPNATFEAAFAVLLGELAPKAVATTCRRFRLSNDESARIAWLVANRDALSESLPNSKLYPLLAHPGIRDLIDVVRARGGEEIAAFYERRLTEGTDFDPPPLLTGDTLIAEGFRPGPGFKTVIETVRASQLDGTISTDREALELAKSLGSRK